MAMPIVLVEVTALLLAQPIHLGQEQLEEIYSSPPPHLCGCGGDDVSGGVPLYSGEVGGGGEVCRGQEDTAQLSRR